MIDSATPESDFTAMRHAMVASQLRTTGVDDPRVVAAMAKVPREAFVPGGARALAYRDSGGAIARDRSLNPPMATGRLLTEARLRASDRVLLIGAASGYTAAVLAELVAAVIAVENDAALARAAHDALDGIAGVTLVEGPLAEGAADHAPFDVILIDGAVEHVPDTLGRQLAPGGRFVAGLVDRGVTRLAAGTVTDRGVALTPFADVDAVVLPGFARARSFTF